MAAEPNARPPDCWASLGGTAEATMLLACEFTRPTPTPPKSVPTTIMGVSSDARTPNAMLTQAAAIKT